MSKTRIETEKHDKQQTSGCWGKTLWSHNWLSLNHWEKKKEIIKIESTHGDIRGVTQHCSSYHPPNTLPSLEHQGRDGNHGHSGRWPDCQRCTGLRGSCRSRPNEVSRMRQLQHSKEENCCGQILSHSLCTFERKRAFCVFVVCGNGFPLPYSFIHDSSPTAAAHLNDRSTLS